MTWRQALLLSCFSAVVLLSTLREGTGASVGTTQVAEEEASEAENRQKLRADELQREYYEEQRNEFENFVEEQNDEQEERSREAVEQWRQWHYDGLHPSYLYNRHHI
ncbi:PREDICTED: unique cartilage matrix-associated protein isoform X2 [Colobus angolensis palliatus]|uniref:unique cartilage matrix-associated protein isoform X2 n=1 Tax=Colobus angolensis palliatus TaxID=336983 RepID=UPI0005F40A84|nr:PREDICTED: unique cartilage matrix-associated protein isoform X2 [Colobus angolensis palliatus]